MKYNPQKHHRRSIRLPGYDYTAPGAYFVTICAQDRICLFGQVVNGVMQLNLYGRVAATYWERLPHHFPNLQLGAWVIMPNHMHGILIITEAAAPSAPPPEDGLAAGSLGAIVGNYKSTTTRRINQMRHTPGGVVWQRNYWEHIIRDDAAYARIADYIATNPARWQGDQLHPAAPPNPFNAGSLHG